MQFTIPLKWFPEKMAKEKDGEPSANRLGLVAQALC